jgi:hypothetical protein
MNGTFAKLTGKNACATTRLINTGFGGTDLREALSLPVFFNSTFCESPNEHISPLLVWSSKVF